MEEKKKQTRKPSKWTLHLKEVRALPENKGLKASEIFKKAKETYKK